MMSAVNKTDHRQEAAVAAMGEFVAEEVKRERVDKSRFAMVVAMFVSVLAMNVAEQHFSDGAELVEAVAMAPMAMVEEVKTGTANFFRLCIRKNFHLP